MVRRVGEVTLDRDKHARFLGPPRALDLGRHAQEERSTLFRANSKRGELGMRSVPT